MPRGLPLSEEAWQQRHRALVILLWLHVVAVPAFGWVMGNDPLHLLPEGLLLAGLAFLASRPGMGRQARSVIASGGLIISSSLVVHLSGGYIEAHFHFFVIVALIALYQSWTPFLLTLGYVVLHHGLVATMVPMAVFNHPDAWANP